jgi:hypothetical protein
MPSRDPIKTATRHSKLARRIGQGRKCVKCGENRHAALIAGSSPLICFECERRAKGQSIYDKHHVAGRSNHSLTVLIPANDHRAVLNEAQFEWPEETLRNPDGSPLLAIAAWLRGFVDTVGHPLDKLLIRAAEFLERLNAALKEHHGRYWWKAFGIEWSNSE